jgi:ubiquinone biosynthesis protein
VASISPAVQAEEKDTSGVIADLPRRKFLDITAGDSALLQMRSISFKASRAGSIRGVFVWLSLIVSFVLKTIYDRLLGRDSIERRAIRLRRAFEKRGSSFIKLGLHLSTRVDFMPWMYGVELSSMTDRMEPFPVDEAIKIIERCLNKPLARIFEQFDPEPILSTSVACFYQALLLAGEKVTVKVRRPGIGEQFMEELKAFEWVLSVAEFLTIFRPGRTSELRGEFRELLLEELDFVNEARRQEGFRRSAEKSRKKFFSAPAIYLDLSGEEVVVSEFKSGMWLWELLAAIEQGNETVLAQAREMNIQPKKIARRLLWVNYWAWEENLFFHADPNPNNIILGRDSTLYFINFAITDSLSRSKWQAMRQILSYAYQRDVQNMARSALTLLEPLPPIDLIEFTQELESYNWQLLFSLEADPKSLTWQERTSAVQWIGLIRLARKYGIVIDTQVLRLIRATLMYESTAVKLHPKIDFVRQYRKFNRYRAEQARRRVTDSVLNALDGSTNEKLIIRLDRFAQTVDGFLTRARHSWMLPSVNFNTLISKWSFAFYIFFRFLAYWSGVTILALGVVGWSQLSQGQPFDFNAAFHLVISNPYYLAAVILLVFISGRTVLFRLDDKEI